MFKKLYRKLGIRGKITLWIVGCSWLTVPVFPVTLISLWRHSSERHKWLFALLWPVSWGISEQLIGELMDAEEA